MASLFPGGDIPAIAVIKWKDIYENMERSMESVRGRRRKSFESAILRRAPDLDFAVVPIVPRERWRRNARHQFWSGYSSSFWFWGAEFVNGGTKRERDRHRGFYAGLFSPRRGRDGYHLEPRRRLPGTAVAQTIGKGIINARWSTSRRWRGDDWDLLWVSIAAALGACRPAKPRSVAGPGRSGPGDRRPGASS